MRYIHIAALSCVPPMPFGFRLSLGSDIALGADQALTAARHKPACGLSRNAVERTLNSNDPAYRAAVEKSEAIHQAAIRRADADYRTNVDDAPKLVKQVSAGSSSAPVAAGLSEANWFIDEAMAAWENAVRTADEQHRDRLAAAGRHYGIVNGVHQGSDPNSEHARVWLEELLGQ
jgi:hypothetical protein